MKIILPVQLNPISRRKDRSVRLSLETRELSTDEILSLMSLEGSEMWMCISPNSEELEIPTERADVEEKSPSERLRNVLFVFFKQLTEQGKYVGTFDNFKRERYEVFIQTIKDKLN